MTPHRSDPESASPDLTVDLNADLGEGPWEQTADRDLLGIVSSANVACGGHAGDAETMAQVGAEAVRRGVALGAHVSYADRENFGRVPMDLPAADLAALVLDQLWALDEIATAQGTRVAYCKPHGALYNTLAHHAGQAEAVAQACATYRAGLPVLGLPGSVWLRTAVEHGLRPVGEAFADRAYTQDGTLVPRSQPGAVLHDPEVIAARVLDIVCSATVSAVTGETVQLTVESVCVHGDTPGAVGIASQVRARLAAAGVRIRSFVP